MAVEFAIVQMLYNNKQISADNKVPAGQSFRLIAGINELNVYYTVQFLNANGTLLNEQSVKAGDIPTYSGSTPVMSDVVFPEAYEFCGWDKELVAVTGDVTYTAQYTVVGVTGECGADGDNVLWWLNPDTGLIIMRGSGAIDNYTATTGKQTGWYAYINNITTAIVGDGITHLGNYVFRYCTKISSVTLGADIETIGNYNFSYKDVLEHIVIPDKVVSLGQYCFYKSTKLASIVLPVSLTTVYLNAFYGCSGLKNVYYKGTSSQWDSITIKQNNSPLTSATRTYNYTG